MKLLTRTTLLYVFITLAAFTAGSVLFYSFLRDLEDEEITEGLEAKREMLLEILSRDSAVQNSPLADDVKIEITGGTISERIIDTIMYDEMIDEEVPYRMLVFPYEKNGRHYFVSIRKPKLESDDLVEGVYQSFVVVLIILAIVTVVMMQIVARRMWRPFFRTLEALQNYRPGGREPIQLPSTRISEFRELNNAIDKMTSNTNMAFQSLKSFSENAAHEIQTPLAVIQSTIEVLQQDPALSEEQHKRISELSAITSRLSNIVSTLLLLTRIENRQFRQDTPINLSDVVSQKIALLHELFDQRGIKLQKNISDGVMVKLHKDLAEILVSNLLVNAIRHTPENGSAFITLTDSGLMVGNSGEPLMGDPTRLFERFYKEDQSGQSTGLGLSLVKMVADTSGFDVNYKYVDGSHVFSVNF